MNTNIKKLLLGLSLVTSISFVGDAAAGSFAKLDFVANNQLQLGKVISKMSPKEKLLMWNGISEAEPNKTVGELQNTLKAVPAAIAVQALMPNLDLSKIDASVGLGKTLGQMNLTEKNKVGGQICSAGPDLTLQEIQDALKNNTQKPAGVDATNLVSQNTIDGLLNELTFMSQGKPSAAVVEQLKNQNLAHKLIEQIQELTQKLHAKDEQQQQNSQIKDNQIQRLIDLVQKQERQLQVQKDTFMNCLKNLK